MSGRSKVVLVGSFCFALGLLSTQLVPTVQGQQEEPGLDWSSDGRTIRLTPRTRTFGYVVATAGQGGGTSQTGARSIVMVQESTGSVQMAAQSQFRAYALVPMLSCRNGHCILCTPSGSEPDCVNPPPPPPPPLMAARLYVLTLLGRIPPATEP